MSFEEIYNRQLEFENLVLRKSKGWPDKPLLEFSQKERTDLSKELALYLYQETAEFVNAVGNYKMHKKQKDVTKIKDVKEEIADILIFAVDLALTHGMTAEEVLEKISLKQDKNFKRQEEGY